MDNAISIILGGLITIIVTMLVESYRRPKLSLSMEDPPLDVPYPPGRPAQRARYLRVILRNKALPRGLRWMQRSAALQCRGEITFHHLNDGQNIFDRSMPVRWVKGPEPVAPTIIDMTTQQPEAFILDLSRNYDVRMDVYPGEEEMLDVAVRFDNETDCYGWNNEGYANNWRTPRWQLGSNRFLVKIVITSSGQKCIGVMRLVNDVASRMDFRLLEATKEDRAKLGF